MPKITELPIGYSDSNILVEPMHLQLGIGPKHTLDYAYTSHESKREILHKRACSSCLFQKNGVSVERLHEWSRLAEN